MENTYKPYLIGETAYIHEGDFAYLTRMVEEISEVGFDAVKFHLLLELGSYMSKSHPVFTGLQKRIFSKKQWSEIIAYANSKGLEIIALCDDVASAEFILAEHKDIRGIEVHATGLNDHYLLDAVSKFPGAILLGISGSTIEEIRFAVDFLQERNAGEIILMYGFQSFPTDHNDINFSKMLEISKLFNLPIGYADHTAFDSPYNKTISILPAAMGFSILEKHYTLDCREKRIDHEAAVGRETMQEIKELMKIALQAYGGKASGYMSGAELEYGRIGFMKKAIVARKFIAKGQKLGLDNLWFKRTGEVGFIKQSQFSSLFGLEAAQDIKEDEVIDFTKVKGRQEKNK